MSARFPAAPKCRSTLTPGFEEVFYNAWNGFPCSYPHILAA